MIAPSPSIRDLAQRLLEASRSTSPARGRDAAGGSHANEVVAVCESLSVAVTRFAGPDGFGALLRRALVLARAEAPVLQGIRLGTNNKLEGLEAVAAGEAGAEAAVALTAHVLMLLVTFIGEPLTMRFVREAWPDAKLGQSVL